MLQGQDRAIAREAADGDDAVGAGSKGWSSESFVVKPLKYVKK